MRFPFRQINTLEDAQRNFEYLEVHGEFDSTVLGGDLTGTLPNPTFALGTYTALTLATNVTTTAGYYTPSAKVQGDTVRLKGVMTNNTGGNIAAGGTWATLPVGMRPTATNGVFLPGVNAYVAVTLAGVVYSGALVANGGTMFLDGITFTIS